MARNNIGNKTMLKTQKTEKSVTDFLNSIKDEGKRQDAHAINTIMQQISGEEPRMWGSSIVGYGDEHLKYASGRELDWMKIGFSPRKQALTLYVCVGGLEKYQDLLDKLGKHTVGKGCLYVRKLSDVDETVLRKIIHRAITS